MLGVRRAARALAIAAAPFGVIASTLAACNDDTPASPPPPIGPSCPRSFAEAASLACDVEGLDCTLSYACSDAIPEPAHCVCHGRAFQCTDSKGNAIEGDAAPACVGIGPPVTGQCPATEIAAEGARCTTAGLQCAYASAVCASSGTGGSGADAGPLDVCECRGGSSSAAPDATPSLRFQCVPHDCPVLGDGGVLDGAPPPTDAAANADGPG